MSLFHDEEGAATWIGLAAAALGALMIGAIALLAVLLSVEALL